MTLSGPDALRSLDDALRDVRREEDDIAKKLARGNEIVGKLHASEAELLRQLAKVRLDPETQKDLNGRLSQAELDARQAQKDHADALGGAEQALADLDGAITQLNGLRGDAQKRIAEAEDKLEALRATVLPRLEADPDYAARRTAAANLAEIAAESMRKTQLAETDREVKGRPYRDDRLFMYLWDAGYGTTTYKAGNLTRYLDSLVARLIRFQDARPNYAMLNEIPLRLREHAERQQENAGAAQAEVQAAENAAVDAAGGKPIRDGLVAAQAEVTAIDAKIVEAEDKRDDAAEEQRRLAQQDDQGVAKALSEFAAALGRENLSALAEEAKATHTGQDDTLIEQLRAARQRADDERKDLVEHEERLKTLAKRRRELEDIQYEFKKQRFDDPQSRFGEDRLAGDMLTDFLRGAMSAADYWSNWQRSQSWTGRGPSGGPWANQQNGDFTWRRSDDDRRDDDGDQPWREHGGGFAWPDNSFAGGSGSGHRRNTGGGFSGGWVGGGGGFGRQSGGGGGGSFSRPRTGSYGTRTHRGFKTGGGG